MSWKPISEAPLNTPLILLRKTEHGAYYSEIGQIVENPCKRLPNNKRPNKCFNPECAKSPMHDRGCSVFGNSGCFALPTHFMLFEEPEM